MRRYTVHVNGTEHVIDVEEVTANSFRVEIDGVAADVRLADHQALSQAMITPQVEVSGRANLPGPVFIAPPAAAPAPAPTAPPIVPTAGGTPASGTDLTAPMPGVVLSVAVEPGNAVKRGDLLMVLEAMKMKNELRARTDGVVAAIPVSIGQQVAYGQQLVAFES